MDIICRNLILVTIGTKGLILSGTVSSLQGRRLEVFGARKNGVHKGEMRGKRDHPPEKPMKIVRKIPIS